MIQTITLPLLLFCNSFFVALNSVPNLLASKILVAVRQWYQTIPSHWYQTILPGLSGCISRRLQAVVTMESLISYLLIYEEHEVFYIYLDNLV